MPAENNGVDATASAGGGAVEDLSEAIEGSIDKQPGEEVRSVRVYGDHYRCNWWVRDAAPGPAYFNVGRITRSKFLRVTRTGDDLLIVEVNDPT
jgi:hypothetical protein